MSAWHSFIPGQGAANVPVGHARIETPRRVAGAVLLALCLLIGLVCAPVSQAAESLKEIRDTHNLNIDKSKISVSGISAGGWMANQFHIANSEKIMGAGILAGGPYHCAGTPSYFCDRTPYGFFTPHDSCQAVHICTRLARKEFPFSSGIYLGPPNSEHSVASTLANAEAGTIDDLRHLEGDRVWLFSGGKDELVPREVMDELHSYYATLFARPEVANPSDNIKYEQHDQAGHGMIISVPGPPAENNCSHHGPPFINDCDYPAAGELLKFIYQIEDDRPAPRPDEWDRDGLVAFDQGAFLAGADESISMNDIGHIYVPRGCRNGEPCPLHVAFHGCQQYQEAIEKRCESEGRCPALYFFRDAGYNEWAERHNIIVLYPQTRKWGDDTDAAKNPRGCWDWWGYSGDDYFRKSGKQIDAVNRMIDCLTGEGPCPS